MRSGQGQRHRQGRGCAPGAYEAPFLSAAATPPKSIPTMIVKAIQNVSWGNKPVRNHSTKGPVSGKSGGVAVVVRSPVAHDREEHDDHYGNSRRPAV